MVSYIRRMAMLVAAGVLVVQAAAAHGAVPGILTGGRSCVGLDPPTGGAVLSGFEPGPGYAGHWGADFEAGPDGLVRAAAGGTVTWSGPVADNLAVTIDHGGGLRTSYSYLSHALVVRGREVERGAVVGAAGGDGGQVHVHLSVRLGSTYVDPEPLVGCVLRAPAAGLRLVEVR